MMNEGPSFIHSHVLWDSAWCFLAFFNMSWRGLYIQLISWACEGSSGDPAVTPDCPITRSLTLTPLPRRASRRWTKISVVRNTQSGWRRTLRRTIHFRWVRGTEGHVSEFDLPLDLRRHLLSCSLHERLNGTECIYYHSSRRYCTLSSTWHVAARHPLRCEPGPHVHSEMAEMSIVSASGGTRRRLQVHDLSL